MTPEGGEAGAAGREVGAHDVGGWGWVWVGVGLGGVGLGGVWGSGRGCPRDYECG